MSTKGESQKNQKKKSNVALNQTTEEIKDNYNITDLV